jgi:PAS domain S-box-containing protein
MRDGDQIAAFRVLRSRPLAVLVEKSHAQVVGAWMGQARWYLSAGVAGVMFILLMTAMAVRSLRAREMARRALDVAQSEVIARERELSVIFGSVQELLFRTDAQGTLTFINALWARATGQARAGAVGARLQDLVTPDSRDAVAALFVANGESRPRHAPARLLGVDGQVRRFELTVVPLDAHGEHNGFAGSGVDVTAIHAVQAELQAQLAFTASLIDTNPLPISVHDAQGRCLRVNQAWESFNGHGSDDRLFDPAGEGLPQLGSVVRKEARVAHRDGSMRDLLVTRSVVAGTDGRPAGIVTAFMDISEIRGAERATREARDLAEEASRAKSEFIANVSHELRTPLQSILGFSELGRLRGRQHVALAAMFDDIHRAGQRMLALVNDLLAVADLESAEGELEMPAFDLGPCVRDVVREFGPLLASKGLSLNVELPEPPLRGRIDPEHLGQVLRNVLGNAIKVSPTGATVDLLAVIGASDAVAFEVRDRGQGIPPAELDSIFEAFVQSSRTKDGSGGTGLGLTICRKILRSVGGRIDARNREGGGACFHIALHPVGAELPSQSASTQT